MNWYCTSNFYKKGDDLILLNTSTDNFLCAYSSVELFYALKKHIKKYVPVTTQEGPELHYLNLRIIQSQYGVSYDQTEHIKDIILDEWFSNTQKENVKPVHTPF